MLDVLGFFINLSNQTKMCIRLFILPTWMLISGLIIHYFINSSLQNISNTAYTANTIHFANLIGQILSYFDLLALLVILAGALYGIWQTYKLWQWENGKLDNICYTCGGIVIKKRGRWGDYYKCLACSNNRSIR